MLLVKIHREIRMLDFSGQIQVLRDNCKHLESACCSVLTNFTADTTLCRRAAECGALDCGR